jgi:hypothetical protein
MSKVYLNWMYLDTLWYIEICEFRRTYQLPFEEGGSTIDLGVVHTYILVGGPR